MRLVTEGCNRFVVLTRRRAIKFPSLRSWRDFLFGLLNNLHERKISGDHPAHCPVQWADPLGLIVIMPRCKSIGPDEFESMASALPEGTMAERKCSSWGWLDGRLVALDYGWPTFGWPRKS